MVGTPTSNIYSVATSLLGAGNNCDERKEIEIVNVFCQGSAEIVSKSVGSMPVMEGFLGDRKVQVLRDSGCKSALVKENLVKRDNLPEKE